MAKEHGLLGRPNRHAILSKEESALLLLNWDAAGSDELELRVEPAFDWLYLHSLLNSLLTACDQGLEGASQISIPKLLHHEFEGGKLALDLRMDANDANIVADLVATSLADAFKVQLAMLIASDADIRRCASCDGWFVVTPGIGRPDKLYCSSACKMRAHRRRKAVR
jgi:hypothetical protein